MKVIIEANPKEIADLVVAIQNRQEKQVENITLHKALAIKTKLGKASSELEQKTTNVLLLVAEMLDSLNLLE